jgi:hypothetical protein
MKQKTEQRIKGSLINILISFGVMTLTYIVFNYFNPSIEQMFLPIIFLLVFILLELPNKQDKK